MGEPPWRTVMNIDESRLVAEIQERAAESKRLKAVLRRPWTEPMRDAQRALVACRRRTTSLCILRAWTRGRFHLQKPLREGAYPTMTWDRERYHELVAQKTAQDFMLPVERVGT